MKLNLNDASVSFKGVMFEVVKGCAYIPEDCGVSIDGNIVLLEYHDDVEPEILPTVSTAVVKDEIKKSTKVFNEVIPKNKKSKFKLSKDNKTNNILEVIKGFEYDGCNMALIQRKVGYKNNLIRAVLNRLKEQKKVVLISKGWYRYNFDLPIQAVSTKLKEQKVVVSESVSGDINNAVYAVIEKEDEVSIEDIMLILPELTYNSIYGSLYRMKERKEVEQIKIDGVRSSGYWLLGEKKRNNNNGRGIMTDLATLAAYV